MCRLLRNLRVIRQRSKFNHRPSSLKLPPGIRFEMNVRDIGFGKTGSRSHIRDMAGRTISIGARAGGSGSALGDERRVLVLVVVVVRRRCAVLKPRFLPSSFSAQHRSGGLSPIRNSS